MTISPTIHAYLEAKRRVFRDLATQDARLSPFTAVLDRVAAEDMAEVGAGAAPSPHIDFGTSPVMAQAMAGLQTDDALAQALIAALPELGFARVFDGPDAPAELTARMHAAALAGQDAEDPRQSFHTGLFVLHPDLHYPLHSHSADEVYLCLSGAVAIQHGPHGTARTLHAGEYSITPPNCVHALRTGGAPVLLAYVWSGDNNAPNWWWHQDASGQWRRRRWQWEANGDWRPYETEIVGPDVLARAAG